MCTLQRRKLKQTILSLIGAIGMSVTSSAYLIGDISGCALNPAVGIDLSFMT